ncbi:MAG: hypothetical protein Q7R96_01535 [Nanoarchaeota archaeon]|nr:hypothetical protein [Nanoarchaeota archaeon]
MPDDEALKRAFTKIKDDILALEGELRQNKEVVGSLRSEILELKLLVKNAAKEESSTGNEGVYAARTQHALSTHSAQMHAARTLQQEKPLSEGHNDIENFFLSLKNYEFKTFLVIYELHEEKGRADYFEIAQKMGVSDACIRSYVSSLLRKGAPVVKGKLNKNKTILSINPPFKSLNVYQKLLALYYAQNEYGSTPRTQTTLTTFTQ